jgi:flagellar hook-length control protein FliK
LTSNIISKTSNLFGNVTESVTFRGKQTSAGFELMLANLKSSAAATNEVPKSDVKPFSQKLARSSANKPVNTADTNQKTEAAKPFAGAVETKQKQEVVTEKSTPTDTATDETVDETTDKTANEFIDNNVLERLVSLVSVVSEIIMDKLDLSVEDFNKLLADQNMTALDLLEPANLQNFVLANSNEESVLALLTNENLISVMKDLNNQINSLKEDTGILQNIDELKKLITGADIESVKNPDSHKDAQDDMPGIYNPEGQDDNIIDNLADETSLVSNQKDVSKSRLTDNKVSDSDASLTTATKADAVHSSQGSSEKDAFDNNSADLKDTNPFQAFVDNMVKSVNNSAVSFNDSILQASDLREIANQVIDKIRISVKPDQTSLEMNLTPESLGKVNLTIHSKEGVMTAHFVVENQISKEAIESQLSTLRETLNQQGIKVEGIEVTVSAYAFEQNTDTSDQNQSDTQKDNSGRHITIDEAMTMSEELPGDDSMNVNNELSDNQINYMA